VTNWQAFKLSLGQHPGRREAIIWQLIAFSACITATSAKGLTSSIMSGVVGFAAMGLVCWTLVLGTAWTGRKRYMNQEEEA
jgi:hypothetical protein